MDICISHMEDVDGIVSASMIVKVTNAIPYLVDYSTLIPTLEEVSKERLDRLFICDLGLGKATQNAFISILKGLRSKGVDITYIDHHDLADEVKEELKNIGINLVHTINECTAVQIYTKYEKELGNYALLAASASIVDDMDHKPLANKLVKSYDRQFLFFEATSLSYSIYATQDNMEFLLYLVKELQNKMPHQIKDVIKYAEEYAEKVSKTLSLVKNNAKKLRKLICISANDLSTGIVANMLLTMHNASVALAYKEKDNGYVISLRGSDECKDHLGRITNSIATELGGSGGGHERACGALIPKARLNEFINKLDSMLQ